MNEEFKHRDTTLNPMTDPHYALESPNERAGWYCHNGARALIKHWLKHGIEEICKEALKRRDEIAQVGVSDPPIKMAQGGSDTPP